jgi:hypothetical protein
LLVTGSGFTRSTVVYVGGVVSPHVQFVSSGVLVATVPSGVTATSEVTVSQQLSLTPSSSVLQPGQRTDLAVTIANLYSFALTDASLTLTVAPGWQVSPSAIPLGTIEPGKTAAEQATVTAPSTGSGSSSITATLRYTANGTTDSTDSTVTVAVPYPHLADAYDNVGITTDTATDAGDFDGSGSSYSATALAALGVTPGSTISHAGIPFTWPAAAPGTADNVLADGQAIAVSGTGTTLGLLATAVNGVNATGAILYTDGTRQPFSVNLPNWDAPRPGDDIVLTTAYRNRPGNTHDTDKVSVWYLGVPLQPGKTVQDLLLPTVGDTVGPTTPSLHIWSIGLG